MRPKVLSAVLVSVLGILSLIVVASCSGDDEPDDAATAGFALRSSAFGEGEPIPPEYAPDGGNQSPPLAWSGVPADTEELAITVVDPDASNFVHWVVWGIDPTPTGEIEANQTPAGSAVGLNQFGEPGWSGPQPPAGEEHTYVFTLHALSEAPAIDATTPALDAVEAIEAVTTDQAELRGQFTSE